MGPPVMEAEMKENGQCAYAKLWGRMENDTKEFEAFVRQLPCMLGRGLTNKDNGFVHIGDGKSTSRHHADIEWKDNQYIIICRSKNGMLIDNAWYGKDGCAELKSNSAIKIGNCSIYFLLPVQSS